MSSSSWISNSISVLAEVSGWHSHALNTPLVVQLHFSLIMGLGCPGKVGEGAVGLGHAVRIFALFNGFAGAVVGVG